MMTEPRKTALVTGASRGTGRATAVALARDMGMRCFLVARGMDDLEVTASEVSRHVGPESVAVFAADVTDDEALKAAVDACVARFGGIDVLVANAGVNRRKDPLQADIKVWDEVLQTNLLSAMHLTRFVLPHITARPGGTIVFMSSAAIRRTVCDEHAHMEPYLASKSGLNGFARTLFFSLAPYGTRVTCINFGITATPLGLRPPGQGKPALEAAKMIQPEDVAASVVYACRMPPSACPLDIDLLPVGEYAAPNVMREHRQLLASKL